METRKEFLEAVMKMANLKDLKQADDAARAVISLTKLIIGEELSQKIAEVSPPDLRQGWESIRAAQMDDYERDERLFETGEVEEEITKGVQWLLLKLISKGDEVRHKSSLPQARNNNFYWSRTGRSFFCFWNEMDRRK